MRVTSSISILSMLACVVGCGDINASFRMQLDLGRVDVDQRVQGFEDAVCADRRSRDCAVLAALAGEGFNPMSGPLVEQPHLPLQFQQQVEIVARRDTSVVVRDWMDEFQDRHDEGELLPPHRLPATFLQHLGVDATALGEQARIQHATLVAEANGSFELPPFDIFVGASPLHPNADAAELDEPAAGNDMAMGEPVTEEVQWHISRSTAFNEDGVADLEFGNQALERLAWAMTTPGAWVEVRHMEGERPELVPGLEPGTWTRPHGVLAVKLDLTLALPLSALAADADLAADPAPASAPAP